MTREEALNELTEWREQMKNHGVPNWSAKLEAIYMAISALEREEADGCVGCLYEDLGEDEEPCNECKNNYTNEWKSKVSHEKERGMSDLISRADAIEAVEQAIFNHDSAIMRITALPSADAVQIPIKLEKRYPESKDEDITDAFMRGYLAGRSSADAVQAEWIPFKKRPLTDEEKQEYPDWTYIFDCPLPDDEEEILLSNGTYVWTDTFINDGECYLDGGDDIDDGMAWMPLPKPYKGGAE